MSGILSGWILSGVSKQVLLNQTYMLVAIAGFENNQNAAAYLTVGADGNLYTAVQNYGILSPAILENRWLQAGAASEYEARSAIIPGLLPYGAVPQINGVATENWFNLGTTRQWFMETPDLEIQIDWQLEIRRVGESIPIATAYVMFLLGSNI